jgi:hypothetical protein
LDCHLLFSNCPSKTSFKRNYISLGY